MAYRIISPRASFVQFSEQPEVHCIYGALNFCLPVAQNNDVSFMYIIEADTEGEIAALASGGVTIGAVSACDDADFLVQFNTGMERSRMNALQVLYTQTNLPGVVAATQVGECFRIRVSVLGNNFCTTTCFERTADDCFTSVVRYKNDDAAFGFPCVGGAGQVDGGEAPVDCAPTVIDINNVSTLTVPYTAALKEKYGDVPTIETFIYDENGVLTKMGITEQLVGFPPTALFFDFGGPAIGKIRIS